MNCGHCIDGFTVPVTFVDMVTPMEADGWRCLMCGWVGFDTGLGDAHAAIAVRAHRVQSSYIEA